MNPIFLIIWLIGVIVISIFAVDVPVVMACSAILPLLLAAIIAMCMDTTIAERWKMFSYTQTEFRLVEATITVEGEEVVKYKIQWRRRFPAGWNVWLNYNRHIYDDKHSGELSYWCEVKEMKDKLTKLRVRYGREQTRTVASYRDTSARRVANPIDEDALRAQITKEVKASLLVNVDKSTIKDIMRNDS